MRIACWSRITMAHGVRGGMERHLESLAEGLVGRGHRVEVFTTDHPDGLGTETIRGVQYTYLRSPAARYRRAWWRVSRSAILDRKGVFDVLWGEGAGAEPVARLPYSERPPVVSILHGTFSGEVRTRLRTIRSPRALALILLLYWRRRVWLAHVQRAGEIIAVSDEVAQDIRQSYRRSPPITVIPNGVDTSRFSPDRTSRPPIRHSLGLPLEATVLIVVGRLEREKGIHQAIEMTARLVQPQLHLLIVGQGEDEGRLRRLAERWEITSQVHFTGFVPNTELPGYLNAADVFVMPTLRDEGFPITIAEAMACGLPVIATRIGGIPTAVDDEVNGLLFTAGDVAGLIAQVKRVLDDPGMTRRLGEAARRKAVEQFSVERMVQDTESVFQQAVQEADAQ